MHRLTALLASRDDGQNEHAHGDRNARCPNKMRLRCPSEQNHAREQAQRPARERRHGDVAETLNVDTDMRKESPQELANRQTVVLAAELGRVERLERGRGRRLELFDILRSLRSTPPRAAEPAIIGEHLDDARDEAHRLSQVRVRAGVNGGRIRTIPPLLQLTQLVARKVDLAG